MIMSLLRVHLCYCLISEDHLAIKGIHLLCVTICQWIVKIMILLMLISGGFCVYLRLTWIWWNQRWGQRLRSSWLWLPLEKPTSRPSFSTPLTSSRASLSTLLRTFSRWTNFSKCHFPRSLPVEDLFPGWLLLTFSGANEQRTFYLLSFICRHEFLFKV